MTGKIAFLRNRENVCSSVGDGGRSFKDRRMQLWHRSSDGKGIYMLPSYSALLLESAKRWRETSGRV